MTEFYFNIATGQVEEGHQSSSDDLMGPYATREGAAAALTTARERTEQWDQDDREWDEGRK